jgi:hypothetical protein
MSGIPDRYGLLGNSYIGSADRNPDQLGEDFGCRQRKRGRGKVTFTVSLNARELNRQRDDIFVHLARQAIHSNYPPGEERRRAVFENGRGRTGPRGPGNPALPEGLTAPSAMLPAATTPGMRVVAVSVVALVAPVALVAVPG